MRIAINAEQLLQPSPGGIGRYTAELLSGLPRLYPDDEMSSFVAAHPESSIATARRKFQLANFHPWVLPLPRPFLYDSWHLFGRPRLSTFSSALAGAQVIHAPSLAVPPEPGHSTKLVVTIHDLAPKLFPETFTARGRRFHTMGFRAAKRRADLVITVSESAARELTDLGGIDKDRIRVVLNGVTPREVSEDGMRQVLKKHGLGNRPYIFWVGTLEPRKNLTFLLQAFSQVVHDEKCDVDLVLAGPSGWLAKESPLVRPEFALLREALEGRIHTLGAVSDDDLAALYKGAQVFAFPSKHEGFGLPILESMSQGTPVICADAGALPEVAGEAAMLKSLDDPGEWAHGISNVLNDNDLRQRLSTAGEARASELSWDRCIHATHDVYRELLS